MTNMLIIIIIQDYYFLLLLLLRRISLLYTRFHSSPVEHENLRSKVVLMSNSTKFFKIHFLKCAKNNTYSMEMYALHN